MLGKVWGLSLLILAFYVAFQVTDLGDHSIPSATTSISEKKTLPHSEVLLQRNEESTLDENEQWVPKSHEEIKTSIQEICTEMKTELEQSKVPKSFVETKLRFHENRLKTKWLQTELGECFPISSSDPKSSSTPTSRKESAASVEIDIFSSKFNGKADFQIQVQVSILDQKSKNKLFELGRKFEMSKRQKKVPSVSTRDQK